MHPFLRAAAARQHGVVTTRDLARAGITPQEVRRAVVNGAWVRLRRGAFVEATALAAADAAGERHLVEAAAVVRTVDRPGAVLSGYSAATVWGLPTPRRLAGTVTLTDPDQHRRGRGYVITHGPLPPSSTTVHRGLPVTTLARTVVDCARAWSMEEAVILADAARWGDRLTAAELGAALDAAADHRGAAAARRAAGLARDGADSPLETLTRLRLHESDVDEPDLQVRISADGVVHEADGWFGVHGIVMACDGRGKYRQPWGTTTEQKHWQEKRQREVLVAAGVRFWTVTNDDVEDGWPRALARLLELMARTPPVPLRVVVSGERRRRPRAG
ncbi:type IV toxin-antitoxin system AbiEi family antitoxin domain-containing protein [Klenkia brasiliensis]|uniref:Transcriptional regulator, AbiEi antitoxin, Type IV TA system n=1 Tax=Klenkia brasiliensis TaxID=333142 RepID=A0A1G7QBF3_9ACTN|nr:type IV toxin-antitoxin system AbiEi family antitoxin domain-containing protein [Klenkia brasiliensis]SDF95856.1 Transcriptional regulator, AbiEi antitoxin, Type IV TA system [Klenkia brasiliensis]